MAPHPPPCGPRPARAVWSILVVLVITALGLAEANALPLPRAPQSALWSHRPADFVPTHHIFLPALHLRATLSTPSPIPTASPGPAPDVCAAVGGTFASTPIDGPPTDRPAEAHPDLNLAIRGFTPSDAPAALVDYGGETDGRAPKLASLLGRLPHFSATYRVFHWDWPNNRRSGPITEWPVTLLGLATRPAEPLRVPDSSYGIGQGFMVLVLYAADERVVLKYTRDDNVVRGYTIHLEGVCVDSALRALYEQRNREGRRVLPGLRAGQAFARARGTEVRIAIRDSGSFMDPRSRKDWWPAMGLTLLGPRRPQWIHAGGREGSDLDGWWEWWVKRLASP
jgi:hypothetical protein